MQVALTENAPEDFMDGVERARRERQMLADTLGGNVEVVRQVAKVIGVFCLIVWVFIAATIFDPDAVQRTWTVLSAGLLSFSFIFSNTIREVRRLAHLLARPVPCS
eukprot:jgi/Ulvmu1/12077/UM083_0090.1